MSVTFKDLSLKPGSKVLWSGVTPRFWFELSSVNSFWVGEVTKVTKMYLSVTWYRILTGKTQIVKYCMNSKVYKQIICDEPEFVEYLSLFVQGNPHHD